jgi:hypothetical protein
MPETREIQTVVEAAEQAAAAGDYAAAEHLLREAALLQEARLGPLHPDLANTLNNLGVVCEIRDKSADAELCYRRAHAIAIAVLEPDHPFVATSRKNLSDFCAARGTPVELPIPPPVVAPERKPLPTNPDGQLREPASRPFSRPFVLKGSRSVPIVALGAGGVLLMVMVFAATRPWFGANRQTEISPGPPIESPASPPPTPEPLPVPPEPVPAETATRADGAAKPVPAETATRVDGAAKGESGRARAASTASRPTVADAQLCRDLSRRGARGDWQCDHPRLPADPGSLFFYTRIRSAGDTTVQHRWYRGNQLRKTVELRVRANTTDGYRTYSRNTVDHQSAGDWRAEVRTSDGILLHEERFVVR